MRDPEKRKRDRERGRGRESEGEERERTERGRLVVRDGEMRVRGLSYSTPTQITIQTYDAQP